MKELNAAQQILAKIGAPFEMSGNRKYGKRRISKIETAVKSRRRQCGLNREAAIKRNAEKFANAWTQINLGRIEREKSRQLRAHNLGRDFSPMPGHPSLIGASA